MQRVQGVNTFYLHQYSFANHKIWSVFADQLAFVQDRYGNLTDIRQACFRHSIGRFQ